MQTDSEMHKQSSEMKRNISRASFSSALASVKSDKKWETERETFDKVVSRAVHKEDKNLQICRLSFQLQQVELFLLWFRLEMPTIGNMLEM